VADELTTAARVAGLAGAIYLASAILPTIASAFP